MKFRALPLDKHEIFERFPFLISSLSSYFLAQMLTKYEENMMIYMKKYEGRSPPSPQRKARAKRVVTRGDELGIIGVIFFRLSPFRQLPQLAAIVNLKSGSSAFIRKLLLLP